jgi:hypothetical protein
VPCSCSRVVEFGCLKHVSESNRKKCGCVCSCILAQTTAPGECKLCKVKGNTSDSGEWCSACGDVWYCGKHCRVGDQIRHNSEDCNDSVQVRFVLGLFPPPLPYAFSSRCFHRALSLSLSLSLSPHTPTHRVLFNCPLFTQGALSGDGSLCSSAAAGRDWSAG